MSGAMAVSLLAAAHEAQLALVVIGGFVGGLLQPIVSKLDKRVEDDPPVAAFWQTPLLGVAAAGISIYVLADSADTEPMRLLFFALLCGLAFPAVLASAVDKVGKRTRQVQEEAAAIASIARSEGIEDTARAAQQLRTLLVQNPPDSVKPEGQQVIETAAQQAVANIAQTPAQTASVQRQVVDELKELGAVAKSAGWDGTAHATAVALQKLSEMIKDAGVKAAAERGAERLANPPA